MKKFLKYFLLGVLFWLIVDFTTTKAIRNPIGYYSTYMPALLFFYIGSPLLFSFLIYKFKLNNKIIFFVTLIVIFIVEILFTNNALLYTFPLMMLTIPIAISIYSFITFVPKWIVNKEIKKNKVKIIIMTIVWGLVSLVTLVGSG